MDAVLFTECCKLRVWVVGMTLNLINCWGHFRSLEQHFKICDVKVGYANRLDLSILQHFFHFRPRFLKGRALAFLPWQSVNLARVLINTLGPMHEVSINVADVELRKRVFESAL